MSDGDTIPLMIVDDHPVFRLGLLRALTDRRLVVVGEAGTGRAAIDMLSRVKPRVALLDVALPDLDGFAVCRAMLRQAPDLVVVMLTSFYDLATLRASRSAGARGHLVKDTAPDVIMSEIDAMLSDRSHEHFPGLREGPLTDRELDVLQCLAFGFRQPDIARELGVSSETVKSYTRELYGKLDAHDRAGALAAAWRRGLIASPPIAGVPADDSTA